MRCKSVRSILPELVSGELAAEVQAEAMSHIESCTQCRAEMLDYEDSLGALVLAWTQAPTPPELDFLPMARTPKARFGIARLGFAAACLVLTIMALAFGPALLKHPGVEHPTAEMRAMSPRHEERPHPDTGPAPQPAGAIEPAQQPKKAPEPQPTDKIEQPRPEWNERRARPRREWENIASATPVSSATDKPKLEPVVPLQPLEPVEGVAAGPDQPTESRKVTRQVVTYDRYGNKQITQVEVEEPSDQPCDVALY